MQVMFLFNYSRSGQIGHSDWLSLQRRDAADCVPQQPNKLACRGYLAFRHLINQLFPRQMINDGT